MVHHLKGLCKCRHLRQGATASCLIGGWGGGVTGQFVTISAAPLHVFLRVLYALFTRVMTLAS